ncbi:glycerate kinase [Candidatus Bathyarchaeota archaeon]|nr:MAG: glycerate kinase [Candidatus Bathyarchaeota archaeon]
MVWVKNREELLDNATSPLTRKAREAAINAVEAAINAVDPRRAVKSKVSLSGGTLRIGGLSFNLSSFKRIIVVGGGKASGSMAEAIEEILGSHIDGGVVVVPHGTKGNYKTRRVELHEAGHPVPDEDSVRGASKILELTEQAGEDDLVICLISGGGSSLMAMPKPGIPLADKQAMTNMLLKCGATINEINTVRKHLSMFKGGQLAKAAYPATLISLILSDVVGDPLEVIASGPTVPDPTTYRDAVTVLKNHDLWDEAPRSVRRVLRDGVSGKIRETPKPGEQAFKKVHNIIVGNNRVASLAAERELRRCGLNTLFLTSFMEGEAREVGIMLAALAREVEASGSPLSRPCGIVVGGETTVTVKGEGIGGRNQEIALSSALKIKGLDGVVIASFSTDGVDGPTDAAGAIVDGSTIDRSKGMGLNAVEYLTNNDSYSFFSRLGDLILTGPTGTNVNDVSVIVCL